MNIFHFGIFEGGENDANNPGISQVTSAIQKEGTNDTGRDCLRT